MQLDVKTRILAGVSYAQVEAHESAKRFGVFDKQFSLAEQVALIHKEASRAFEISLIGDGPCGRLPEVTRLEEALSDIVIHCLVLAADQGLHLSPALLTKLEYNESMSQLVKKDF